MDVTRREFCVVSVIAIAISACGTNSVPTAPSVTTPLIDLLRRDRYAVEEIKNSVGGVILRINGKFQQVKVGTVLVGIDPGMGMDPAKSGPPTLNFGQYPVPDNLGYVLVT